MIGGNAPMQTRPAGPTSRPTSKLHIWTYNSPPHPTVLASTDMLVIQHSQLRSLMPCLRNKSTMQLLKPTLPILPKPPSPTTLTSLPSQPLSPSLSFKSTPPPLPSHHLKLLSKQPIVIAVAALLAPALVALSLHARTTVGPWWPSQKDPHP